MDLNWLSKEPVRYHLQVPKRPMPIKPMTNPAGKYASRRFISTEMPPTLRFPLTEDDITLQTGDVVFVAVRPAPKVNFLN